MSTPSTPALSVVLPADVYDTVRPTLEALRAQTAAERIEVVLVTPSARRLALPDGAAEGLHALQVVEVPPRSFEALNLARAAGVRAARAPVVAFGETHSFPDREWAAVLLEAHEGPWSVVGPALRNANPQTAISWSNLLLDYGPWLRDGHPEETAHVPGHNSSFKRDVLLAYGGELEHALESDVTLIEDLHARGHRLYFAPAARTRHLNVDRPASWLVQRLAAARAFAASRAEPWPWWRRLAYAAGSPLIPAVRARRILRQFRQVPGRTCGPAALVPALAVGLAVSAFGELLGYAFGPSERGMRWLSSVEVRRVDHVRPAHRPSAGPTAAR